MRNIDTQASTEALDILINKYILTTTLYSIVWLFHNLFTLYIKISIWIISRFWIVQTVLLTFFNMLCGELMPAFLLETFLRGGINAPRM